MKTTCDLGISKMLTDSFCEQITSHLQYVARRRLNTLVRPHLDSVDVTQMVWQSFLRHDQNRFAHWNKKRLKGYIHQVLENKIKEIHRRYLSAQKRDVRRECGRSEEGIAASISRDPSPGLEVENAEIWSRLCRELTDVERRVLHCRVQGMSLKQIASHVEFHPRSVQKVMSRVRKKFVATVVR